MPEREPTKEPSWLTENELLFERVSHARFLGIVQRRDVAIHQVKTDHNSYGEFLFVTASRRVRVPKAYTFYGLGFHEHRERWYLNTWRFFESQMFDAANLPKLANAEALRLIADRETEVRTYAAAEPSHQSGQAQLYELLADLTDDDGALSEMEDLGWPSLDDD